MIGLNIFLDKLRAQTLTKFTLSLVLITVDKVNSGARCDILSYQSNKHQHVNEDVYFQAGFFTLFSNKALYPYLDSPSTSPPADKLISKRMLGML